MIYRRVRGNGGVETAGFINMLRERAAEGLVFPWRMHDRIDQ